DLVLLDGGVPWDDLLEQLAQRRNVPLTAAQLVEQTALRLLSGHLERQIKDRLATTTRNVLSSTMRGSRTVSTMAFSRVRRCSTLAMGLLSAIGPSHHAT